MSDTFDAIREHAGDRKTQRLIDKIEELLDGHDGIVVMAALTQVLVMSHLDMSLEEDGSICPPCANAQLTELLQAIRGINDGMIDGIPRADDH